MTYAWMMMVTDGRNVGRGVKGGWGREREDNGTVSVLPYVHTYLAS